MSRQAIAGRIGPLNKRTKQQKKSEAVLTPLDYALALMRDETQPAALRASMAKAALPFLHGRHAPARPPLPEVETPPMSDFELARRIHFILTEADRSPKPPRKTRRKKVAASSSRADVIDAVTSHDGR